MVSTWVLYIPTVKEKLALSDGQVGIALFFFSVGTLSMVPIAPKIIKKIGVHISTLLGISIFSILFIGPLLSNSFYLLCTTLFVTGLFGCLTDVSMNALVSEIEQKDEVHIMSASHGFFSLGGVIGAGLGSLLFLYVTSPVYHMILAAMFVLLSNLILCRGYLSRKFRIDEEKDASASFSLSLWKPLAGFTIIAFLIMGSEGAVEHWSTLYLSDVVILETENYAGLGFFIFSTMMTLGRFLGDAVSKRFGSYRIIMTGCLLGMIGFLTILTANFIPVLLGFGLVGIGFSVIIPELFRLAGRVKGISSAQGISIVAGFGYVGFLASPPFLGFLSDLYDLRASFTALCIGAGTALAIVLVLFIQKQSIETLK